MLLKNCFRIRYALKLIYEKDLSSHIIPYIHTHCVPKQVTEGGKKNMCKYIIYKKQHKL